MSEFVKRKAKTHKGRKILEDRESKIYETEKKTVFLKANKTSNDISTLMHDLYTMKKANSVLVNKRVDIKPFENASIIENYSKKNEAAFVCVGSNTKKRPDNLLISRIYDEEVLDMFEFGVSNFKARESFKAQIDIPSNA